MAAPPLFPNTFGAGFSPIPNPPGREWPDKRGRDFTWEEARDLLCYVFGRGSWSDLKATNDHLHQAGLDHILMNLRAAAMGADPLTPAHWPPRGWPFFPGADVGYECGGYIRLVLWNGRIVGLHVIACVFLNGPPPEDVDGKEFEVHLVRTNSRFAQQDDRQIHPAIEAG